MSENQEKYNIEIEDALEMKIRVARLLFLFSRNKRKEYFDVIKRTGGADLFERSMGLIRIYYNIEDLSKILFKILKQISTESTKKLHDNLDIIKGNLDWKRTLMNSLKGEYTTIPTKFVSEMPESKFVNPENVFLSYVFLKLKKDIYGLKKDMSSENLIPREEKILEEIQRSCEEILKKIPLRFTRSEAKYLLESSDKSERELLQEVKQSLNNTRGGNPAYFELLRWFEKYKNLDFDHISNISDYQLEDLKDEERLNKLYEIWFLLEFAHYLEKEGHQTKFESTGKEKTKISFKMDDSNYTLYYQTSEPLKNGWARRGVPDYVFTEENSDRCVIIDAKNWGEERSDASYKMLGYLHNFEEQNGILIFPLKAENNLTSGVPYDMEHTLLDFYFPPGTENSERDKKMEDLLNQLKDWV